MRSPGKYESIRVALFTGAYNHIADGVSLTLNRLVDYLGNNGVEVVVFAPSISDPVLDHAGTLVEIPSASAPGRPDYRVAIGLTPASRSKLEAFDPDIIHIATPDFLGRSALQYARKHSIPVVASYHTHFSSYLKYYKLGFIEGALWKYLQWFYGNCEQIYVPSESMASVLRSHGITDGLLDWPRGVETNRFSPEKRSENWRASMGFAPGDVVIAFVGRLVWEKGLDVFAESIGQLRARRLNPKSIIVGDGPTRADLMTRLPDTVFAGHLEGDELATAYASSDVFLFPSETETFGNVTLEAMASGLPAVCADATGSSTLVQHGETGFLAEPKNVSVFADYLQRLITDSDLRHSMSVASRKKALKYDWDAVLSKIPRYYRQLLADLAAPADDSPLPVGERSAASTDPLVEMH